MKLPARRSSKHQQETFYLTTRFRIVAEKAKVVLVQGFGRFGPFGPRESDSTGRFDLRQDWGRFFWLPLVMLRPGRVDPAGPRTASAGQPPPALSLLVCGPSVRGSVVTLYLPMAWDRYLLPIQSGNALLAAVAVRRSGIDSPRGVVRGSSWRGLDRVRIWLRKPAAGSSSSCWAATRSSGIRATGTPPAG